MSARSTGCVRSMAVMALAASASACGDGGSHAKMRFVDDGRNDAGRTRDAALPVDAARAPADASEGGALIDSSIRIDRFVHPDAAPSSEGGTCSPAPALPPTGPGCTAPGYAAAAERHAIWVEDPASPGTGTRLDLAVGETGTAYGHSFKNTGNGLFGGGPHGVYGDALFDVDSVSNALAFHLEGCAVPDGPDRWTLAGALTRNAPILGGAAETIARNYVITRTGSGSSERYTFIAEGAPIACGAGVDLVEMVEF